MFIRSFVLFLIVVDVSALRFPLGSTAAAFLGKPRSLVCKDIPQSQQISPFGESGEEFEEVVKEKSNHIELSGLLASDASDWGIKTALAEEHISLGNYDEAVKLAREAMALADHVRQPDSVYHAFAEGILGDAYYKSKDFQSAANRYHSALKAYERHYRSESGPESIELMGATQLVAW